MRTAYRSVVIALLAVALAGCTSSKSDAGSGPPSCSDTSANAARLAHGCTLHGKTYRVIIAHCADGRTMYNVPDAPPDGVSGFTGGKLRDHAVSAAEVVKCQTGNNLTS